MDAKAPHSYINYFSFKKLEFKSKVTLLIMFFLVTHVATSQTTSTFNFTGGSQTFVVPPCVTSIAVTINGGQGGGTTGGLGATVTGNIIVTPGQALQIIVGGQGSCPGTVYAGGGPSATQNYAPFQPCGGGGYSAIFSGGTPLVLAAGGGGKAGGDMGGAGGAGGCATGVGGTSPFGQAGGGATQTAGGAGGPPWTAGGGSGTAGSYLQGGTGGNDLQYGNAAGGGGGGGYYGGGGGGSDNISGTTFVGGGGGGGGSSLVPTGFGCVGGGNAGPGQVVIAYVAAMPVITVNSATICQGLSAVLTASGGTTYTWQPGGMTGSSISVSPGATTTYTVSSGSAGCVATKTTQVVVNPAPVAFANSNSPVCLNTPINFVGSGGGTYSWSGPNGFSSTLQNPVIASAQTIHGGTYSLLVTNAAGCTATATEFVTVNPLPVPIVNNPTVCVNQSINLTASGGSTYSWSGPNGFSSTLQNPTLPNATMLMSGNYPVLVTSAAGCTASATSSVTVITLPNPSFTSNIPCVGTTLTFTGSGGGLYNWTGPNGFTSGVQNPTIPNVSMAANGTYSLIVTIGTCSNITSGAVTVNPLPVPTASNNSPVCVNTSLNLTGGGGISYSWSGPNGYTNSTQNPVIASAQSTNTGVYSLTVTNSNGCTNTITTNVTINPLPVIAVTHPTVCVNQTINLSSSGGATYAWSGPLGYSSSLQNPLITNATQNMFGSYTVTATSAAGCTMTNVSNVLVLALPTPSITSNTPCAGATLFLGGSGGGAYSWSGPNGFTSTSQSPNISNVSMAANGVYTLLVSVGICTNNTTSQVTINPLPTPAITGNSAVCLNQSTGFTATGGVSYTWAGPNGFTGSGPSITISSANNLNTGSYVVTATNANNCSNTASAFLTVNPLPVIAAIGSTVCANQNITLSASGGTMYVWNGQNGFTSGAQFPVISNASASMSGNYSVTVTDVNGCISTSVTNVKVNPIPTPTAAGNSPICANQTITLNAGAPTGVSYIWSGPNGYVANAQNLQITPANVSYSGPYVVTVSDNIGCAASVTVNMIVNPLPSGVISSDKKEGCIPLCVSFTCQAATALQSCVWDFGTGGSAVGNVVSKCYEKDGTFNIKAIYTDINGCSNSSTYSVVAHPIPSADFNFAPQKPVEGEDVQFTNSSYGQGTSFYWYFSHLTNTVIAEHNPAMIYQIQGGYAVTLITVSDKGCRDTITKAVMVGEDYGLYVPNAFTPNGDGINDVFFPKGFGIVKYELNIFDRWGERLFTTNKFEEGWPGNYTGRTQDIVPNGVYVWQIRLVNVFGKSKELTGKVTVTK